MGGSLTVNVLVYTRIVGSPKNKAKPCTPVGIWIIKDVTKFDDKYHFPLEKR